MAISFHKPKVIFQTFFCLAAAIFCFVTSYYAQVKGFGMWYFACLQLLMIVNAVNAWSNFIKWMDYR